MVNAVVAVMVSPMLDGVRSALHRVAHHTGLPIAVLAAALLVTAWNVARKAWRILVQFLLVLGALAIASRLGWISW